MDDLTLREHASLYPPRFILNTASSTAHNSKAVFTFEGATEEIVKEVILTTGIVYIAFKFLYTDAYGILGQAWASSLESPLAAESSLMCMVDARYCWETVD